MTLPQELPPALECCVNSEAPRRGLAPADYVLDVVRSASPEGPSPDDDGEPAETEDLLVVTWPEGEPRPTTGAEVVAYWERHGLLGTRPDISDSLEHARALRRKAER